MRRLITLMVFTPLLLIGMESSEDSSSDPSLPPTPEHSSQEEVENVDMEALSRQALSLFFEDETGTIHSHGFSCELTRRIYPHVTERNGSLRRLMNEHSLELHKSEDRPRTPEQSLRKELRDIVVPTLTELFDEQEEEHTSDRKKLNAERLKFRLALITAATTMFTTTAATITAIVIALNT